jgi:gas vesicle protein
MFKEACISMSGKSIGFLAVGLGLGAAVGMLYAPRSGRVTRRFVRSKANSAVGYAKERSGHLRSTAKEQLERGKQRIADTKNHIVSAFEAGRQAYRETSESFASADQA